MEWLTELSQARTGTAAVAWTVVVLSLAGALGLALGRIRIAGFQLGIAGVLFVGLAFGHFGVGFDLEVLEFVREFGLILFVFTIGMQVGPGFFASLRRHGLPLAGLAALIVVLGTLTAVILSFVTGTELPVMLGVLSGATTNTPSLGAAQQALKDVPGIAPETLELPALGYAIAYPFGILGVILAMVFLRRFFHVDVARERADLEQAEREQRLPLATLNIEVQNPNLEGLSINRIPVLRESGLVISRLWQAGQVLVPRGNTCLHIGDVLLAVGPRDKLEEFRVVVGRESKLDLRELHSGIISQQVVVTRNQVLGRSIQELNVATQYGVTVTRVSRADIEFTPTRDFRLQFADTLLLVGEQDRIERAAIDFGNSPKELNQPMLAPIFFGIAAGVLAGTWPLALPGLPLDFRLGLAGGPLLAGLLFSRLSHIGPLVWYMPIAANYMLRELGIVLFLVCVGLRAGGQFTATLLHGQGLSWLFYGMLITLIPVLVGGLIARMFMKLNYVSLCGVLAGSMTDPPALAFASTLAGSDAPAISYATVYPLTMLLRVLLIQVIVLLFMGAGG